MMAGAERDPQDRGLCPACMGSGEGGPDQICHRCEGSGAEHPETADPVPTSEPQP